MRRALPLLLSASLVALSLLAIGGPSALAAGADSCDFEDSTGVLNARGGVAAYAYQFGREAGSKKILFRNSDGTSDPCIDGSSGTRATVLNTDTIRFVGSSVNDSLWLNLQLGNFAPGATPEASGSSEIEFKIFFMEGTDELKVYGSPGDDVIRYTSGGMHLNGDSDEDVSASSVDSRTAYGNEGSDRMSNSTWAPVSFYGGDGGDVLVGGGGGDYLGGDAGPDVIEGGAGADSLYGGDGNDDMSGGSEGDRLQPGMGDDVARGDADDDSLICESSPDGADTLLGGAGDDDEVSYYGRTSKVTADLAGDADDGSAGEKDRIGSDVETLYGGLLGDRLAGNSRSNTLYGWEGPDELTGGDGDDYMRGGAGAGGVSGQAGDDSHHGDEGSYVLSGGDGSDGFYGGAGDDQMNGGAGNDYFGEDSSSNGSDRIRGGTGSDVVYYSSRAAAVDVTLDDASNDGEAGEGDNVRSDVEDVGGGSGDDTITGSAAVNSLSGNGGADTVDGRGDQDTVSGNAGADDLSGGEGADSLYGGDDADVMHSDDGGAYDYVSCGNGADDATDNDSEDSLQADCELT